MTHPHDDNYKFLYDHAIIIRDLLDGFISPEFLPDFELIAVERLSGEYVSDDLRQSRSDTVWRVRFRSKGKEGCFYLLVLLEFQSTVDRRMALRILNYTGQMYQKLIRNEGLSANEPLPPVLPIVIYNGRAPRWSAAAEMREMIASVDDELEAFQPRQRYIVLDLHALDLKTLPEANIVSSQILLERGSLSDLAPELFRLNTLLAGEEFAGLRQGFAKSVRWSLEGSSLKGLYSELEPALRRLEETGELAEMSTLLAERIDEYLEQTRKQSLERGLERGLEQGLERGLEQGLERGLEQGLEQGLERGLERGLEQGLEQQRTLLLRLASRKFDSTAVEQLSAHLEAIDDTEHLAGIGEAVIDCADGAQLLARIRDMASTG